MEVAANLSVFSASAVHHGKAAATQPAKGVQMQPLQGVVVTQPVQGVVVTQPLQQGAAQIPPPGQWLTPWINTQQPTCIMAVCCSCVYIAQLHERVVKRQSFPKVLGILVGVQVVGWILKFYGEHIFIEVHTGNRMIDALGWLPILVTELAVGLVYLKYVIAIRKQMRARDHIQSEMGACGPECCTSYWCQCCVICQMYAHDNELKGLGPPCVDPMSPMGLGLLSNQRTGEEKEYPLVEGEHVV